MCNVLLSPGVNPSAVNKHIISYHIITNNNKIPSYISVTTVSKFSWLQWTILHILGQPQHTSSLNSEHNVLTRKESEPNTAAMIMVTAVCAHHKIWHIAQRKTTHTGHIPTHCKTWTIQYENCTWPQLILALYPAPTIGIDKSQRGQLQKQHNKHNSFTSLHDKR